MRQHVAVCWGEGLDFNLHADPSVPMSPDQARSWLDAQFTAMECEPLRALGKVLTADKVLRVTQAAGPARLRDETFAAAYAQAVLGALGKPMVRVDVPSMTVTW